MGARIRKKTIMLKQLLKNPEEFDFFQAVRLLSLILNTRETQFAHNCIRFRSVPSFSFPSKEIYRIEEKNISDMSEKKYFIYTSFISICGQMGIMPNHYLELLLNRIHEKDEVLYDFLNFFHHPIVTLFYQAWEKNNLPILYEKSPANNPLSTILSAYIGITPPTHKNRLCIPDEALYFYAGIFSHNIRSVEGLKMILNDYFALPIAILPFQGRWLSIQPEQQCRLTVRNTRTFHYNELGKTATVGEKFWEIQSNFRVYIGPLSYQEYRRLLPDATDLKLVQNLIRFYVGIEFEFDIQLELITHEIPYCQIRYNNPLRLGWNTWIKCNPMKRNANDLIIKGEFLHVNTQSKCSH